MKRSLRPSEVSLLVQTIDNYKKNDNYEQMVTSVVGLFTERDGNFHLLARECSDLSISGGGVELNGRELVVCLVIWLLDFVFQDSEFLCVLNTNGSSSRCWLL